MVGDIIIRLPEVHCVMNAQLELVCLHLLQCRCLLSVSDFRSFIGCFAVGSLVVLPVWLFALHKGLVVYQWIPLLLQHAITFILAVGRSLCVFVEVRASFLTAVCCLVFLVGLSVTFFVAFFTVISHQCFVGDKQCWGLFQQN